MKRKSSDTSVETRKEEIIRTAAKIFAAKGYHGTTLDEIAREIGVTKPALYYHIKSKGDILREIVGMIMEPMEEVAKAGRSEKPPRERVEAIIRLLVKYGAERKETSLIALEQSNILPKRSRDALRRRQKDLEYGLQTTLKEGVEKGDFVIEDIKVTSYAILQVANFVYRWYRADNSLNPEQIADRFIHLLEYGFMKK
jgi:AcrR family transcriptional regulator